MVSAATVETNLTEASALLEAAADAGAALAVLPENFACMPADESDRRKIVEEDGTGPIQDFLSRRARELGIWIVGGTIPVRVPGDERPAAACLVYDGEGRRVARYDKMYLFDVSLPGRSESYRESDNICPGNTPVVTDSPIGRLGLAVCYDLRFPERSSISARRRSHCRPRSPTVPVARTGSRSCGRARSRTWRGCSLRTRVAATRVAGRRTATR
jgi:nitrilase